MWENEYIKSRRSDIVSTNLTIDKYEYITIPESTIGNWRKLSSISRNQLCILLRKYSLMNWYYKANNKNAEEIYYIMNEEFSDMEEQDL